MITFLLIISLLTLVFLFGLRLILKYSKWKYRGSILIILSGSYLALFFWLANFMCGAFI